MKSKDIFVDRRQAFKAYDKPCRRKHFQHSLSPTPWWLKASYVTQHVLIDPETKSATNTNEPTE